MTRTAPLSGLVAIVALWVVFGVTSAAAPPSDAKLLPPGDFDSNKALALIFPGVDTQGNKWLWNVPNDAVDPSRGKPRWDLVELKVLDSIPFRQGKSERSFFVFQSVPAERDYACRACAPAVGAATFTSTSEGWQLDSMNWMMGSIGSDGKVSKPRLVQLGPERFGIVFSTLGMGQGTTLRADTYFIETGTSINEVLQLETYADNAGNCGCLREDCDPDDPEASGARVCVERVSTVELVPGKNAKFFDLRVTELDRLDDRYKRVTLYKHENGTYQVASP